MVKSFQQYLSESSTITVYHGDRHNTAKLDVNLMNNGNNEEGIGIYFSDNIATAKSYGPNIVSATIDPSNFVDSRSNLTKLGKSAVIKILTDMWKNDSESFFYYVSDFVEISDENQINNSHVDQMFEKNKLQQIRNWQTEMCEKFGVESFVASWNKNLKYDGTKYSRGGEMWYAIIDPNIKVTKVT